MKTVTDFLTLGSPSRWGSLWLSCKELEMLNDLMRAQLCMCFGMAHTLLLCQKLVTPPTSWLQSGHFENGIQAIIIFIKKKKWPLQHTACKTFVTHVHHSDLYITPHQHPAWVHPTSKYLPYCFNSECFQQAKRTASMSNPEIEAKCTP